MRDFMRKKTSYLSLSLLFTSLLTCLWIFQSCSCGCGCGCGCSPKAKDKAFHIGFDPAGYPQNFQKKSVYVFGFIEDLLIEISKEMNVEFQRIGASGEDLIQGLKNEKFDGIFLSISPSAFNKEGLLFSDRLFLTSPVLVIPKEANYENLSDLAKKSVGILENSQNILLLQKYSDMLVVSYTTSGEALNALSEGKVYGVVLPHMVAIDFLQGVYADKFKIAKEPLSDEGYYLVLLKDKKKSDRLLLVFQEGMKRLEKKGKVQDLLEKWKLNHFFLSSE
jgi:ABC-type amino acid transport substrate-binding protein